MCVCHVPVWRPSLCKVVKVKPGLFWRSQNDGDARAVENLLMYAVNREWTNPKEKCVVAVSKNERSWAGSPKDTDILSHNPCRGDVLQY